jgi:predicted SnoaL-like aldol condensation-catalyzing enzyme
MGEALEAEAANRALVSRLYEEVFNQHHLAALDTVLAADFVDHSPLEGQTPGRDGFRESVAKGQANMPDMRFTIEEMIAERDLVAIRQRMRFTHHGSPVEFAGMGFFRCHAGQIAEAWWTIDSPKLPPAEETA